MFLLSTKQFICDVPEILDETFSRLAESKERDPSSKIPGKISI
jgi:hypothetical protein